MAGARQATPPEAAAILGALPRGALARRFEGAVASVLVEHEGTLLDGAVVVGDPPEVRIRPLPQRDRSGLDAWIALIERRRAQIAHDASGQATGVLAALETVLEYEPISDGTRSLLEDARGGIFRLTKILGDRASALLGQPNVVAGALDTLIERLARATQEALDPSCARLVVRVDAKPDEVRFDAMLLEGAFAVLLTNAWKFRRGQEARVVIEAVVEEGVLRLTVSDDGRGLDPVALRSAGELGFTTRPSGVGLGLFTLRRAVSAQRGAVVLAGSERGLRASVLLPMNSAGDGG